MPGKVAMTARRIRDRTLRCPRLRAFGGLDAWCVASAGFEAQQVVSVGSTKWTICFKLHVIPTRRTQYKASITLWPTTRGKRAHPGWHPHLVNGNWYQACQRELRRYGYHGSWLSSPHGRFGDFWKTLSDFDALAREARFLERLRKTSRLGRGRRTSRLSGPA